MMDAVATHTATDHWARWDKLKSELFTPVKLSKDQRTAIDEAVACAREGRDHPESFRRISPIIIATLKSDAVDSIRQIATAIPGLEESHNSYRGYSSLKAPAQELCERIRTNVRRMATALLGDHIMAQPYMDIGHFSMPKLKPLHCDPGTMFFVLRAEALPWKYVTAADEKRYPDLIRAGSKDHSREGDIAREELDGKGILQTSQLNALYLIPAGPTGLLHCSGAVPEPIRGQGHASMSWGAPVFL